MCYTVCTCVTYLKRKKKMSTTLTIRISDETKEKIEKLSLISKLKKSEIINRWINEKLDVEQWQIAKTYKAIEQAEAGDFAKDEEVAEFFTKWTS